MYGLDNIWKFGAKKSKYWENHLLKLFLAMHITNQKLSFDIFTVKYLNILMIFGIKREIWCIVGYCCKYTPSGLKQQGHI